jgi:hypothetical protein
VLYDSDSLRAERRVGEMLKATDLAKGTRSNTKNFTGGQDNLPPDESPKLSEIGITKQQSSDWQRRGGPTPSR